MLEGPIAKLSYFMISHKEKERNNLPTMNIKNLWKNYRNLDFLILFNKHEAPHLTLKFVKRLSSYIVLPFLISACAHIPPPVEKPKVPSLDGKAILQRVELHKAKTTSFQGTARVEFRRGGEKFSGKQEIVAQAPSSLAVETVSPFGTMVSLLIASPEKLSFYEADQHRLFQGKPIKTHLSQLFPIYLDVKDVVNIILYQPQIIPCQR